jgi:antirestriction protein
MQQVKCPNCSETVEFNELENHESLECPNCLDIFDTEDLEIIYIDENNIIEKIETGEKYNPEYPDEYLYLMENCEELEEKIYIPYYKV